MAIFQFMERNEKLKVTNLYKILGISKKDGWWGGKAIGVDSVHSGMSAMLHEILHDSDALHRGMHAMVHELLFCSVHE